MGPFLAARVDRSLTGGWYLPRLVRSSWGEATADDHTPGWRSARIRARESCSASTWASLSWTRRRAGDADAKAFQRAFQLTTVTVQLISSECAQRVR